MTAPDRAPARSRAEQLFLSLAAVWADRHAAAHALDQADPQRRPTAAGVVDGFALLYLLALLIDEAPYLADRAERFLSADGMPASLPAEFVATWRDRVDTGATLRGYLP